MKHEFTKPLRMRFFPMGTIALLACLASILPAVPARAAEDQTSISVSIFCAAYAADLKAVFVKNGTDNYQEIGLSTANVIETRKVFVEDGRVLLYGPAGEDGKRPVVADAEISGIKQPLIVLCPATEKGGMSYASKAVEADHEKFPLGSFSLVNLSPHPVRIIHEEETIELECSAGRIYKPDHTVGDSLAMKMEYKNGEIWALLSSARWAARDDRRTLVCFQLDPSSKRMNVKSVPLRENSSR